MFTNLKHANHEARLLLVALGSSLMFDMLDPMLLILGTGASIVSKAAIITGFPIVIAGAFGAAAALLIPLLIFQIFCPAHEERDFVIRLALIGLALGGVVWMFLAYTVRVLDYTTVTSIFARNGIWNIFLAGILAYRLNYQQQRRQEEPPCTSA